MKRQFWELYDLVYEYLSLDDIFHFITFQQIDLFFERKIIQKLEEYSFLFRDNFIRPNKTINQIIYDYKAVQISKQDTNKLTSSNTYQSRLPLGSPTNIHKKNYPYGPWGGNLWLIPPDDVVIPKQSIDKGSDQLSSIFQKAQKYLSKGLVRNMVKHFGNSTLEETLSYFGSKNKENIWHLFQGLPTLDIKIQNYSLEWALDMINASFYIINDTTNYVFETFKKKELVTDIGRLLLGRRYNSTSLANISNFFKVASDNHTFYTDREFFEMSDALEAKAANIRILQSSKPARKNHNERPKIEIVKREMRVRKPRRTPLPFKLPDNFTFQSEPNQTEIIPKALSIRQPIFDIDINNISRNLWEPKPIVRNRYTPFYEYYNYGNQVDLGDEENVREKLDKKYEVKKEVHWLYNSNRAEAFQFNGTADASFIEGSDKTMKDIIKQRKSHNEERINTSERISKLQSSYDDEWTNVNRERVYRAIRIISNSSISDKVTALLEGITTESFLEGIKRVIQSMDENETIFRTMRAFFDSSYFQNICEVLENVTESMEEDGNRIVRIQEALGESVLPNLTQFISKRIPDSPKLLSSDFEFKKYVKEQLIIEDYDERFHSLIGIGSSLVASGAVSIPFVSKQLFNFSTNDVLLLLDGLTQVLSPYIKNNWFGKELIENMTSIRSFIFENQKRLKAPFIADATPFPKLSLRLFRMWIQPKTTIDILLKTLDEDLQIDRLCSELKKKPMMKLFDVFRKYKKEHRFLGFAKGILDYFYRAIVLVNSEAVSPYELIISEISPFIISKIQEIGKMTLYEAMNYLMEKDVLDEIIRVARHATF